jgi:hypothetical protein
MSDILSSMKQIESSFSLICDRINALDGKLESFLFRAQRLAHAFKNNLKSPDSMFGYDLQGFRREIRNFSHEVGALPGAVGAIERMAEFSENAVKPAQGLMRVCAKVNRSLKTLQEHALLAHQHMRAADHKIEAWYMVQEIDQMAAKGQALSTIANRVVIRVSDPNFKG